MIVRRFKVWYICSNPSCRMRMSMSTINSTSSRDVTGIWLDINGREDCYKCNWPMDVREVKCKVSTDIFGTDLEGSWSCDDHPYITFHPIPLRKSYYGDKAARQLFPLYGEITRSGFPWRCPTCKEPMKYAEERDATYVG